MRALLLENQSKVLETLLVVDDEIANLTILKNYFISKGYQVITANNGYEAWGILTSNQYKFNTIITDRFMPKLDGIELIKKIKHHDQYKNIPVVMQTSAIKEKQIIEGLNAGAYYYLTKPYKKDTIIPIVKAAVEDYTRYSLLRKSLNLYSKNMVLMKSAIFEFQTLTEAESLAGMLAQACPKPEKAVLGISELAYNAVEHGNLDINYHQKSKLIKEFKFNDEIARRLKMDQYKDKKATLMFSKNPKEINIYIKDHGNGFNWEDFINFSSNRVFDTHGRGIALANKISFDSLEYLGKGNEVKAVINL